MSGTVSGGKKQSNRILKKHGKDFYQRIGRKGGKKSTTGGFASNKVGRDGLTGLERAKLAGQKGGRISKRKPSAKKLEELDQSRSKLANVLREYLPSPKDPEFEEDKKFIKKINW